MNRYQEYTYDPILKIMRAKPLSYAINIAMGINLPIQTIQDIVGYKKIKLLWV